MRGFVFFLFFLLIVFLGWDPSLVFLGKSRFATVKHWKVIAKIKRQHNSRPMLAGFELRPVQGQAVPVPAP